MDPSEETNAELESFREQWRREVQSRNLASGSQQPATKQQIRPGLQSHAPSQSQSSQTGGNSSAAPSSASQRPVRKHEPPKKAAGKKPVSHHDDDYVLARSFDEPGTSTSVIGYDGGDDSRSTEAREPVSALEHYEKAVEKEAIGNLGDSLRLYRKAFRMDDRVDQKYKNKHFPKQAMTKPNAAGASGNSGTSASTGKAPADGQPLPMKELITSFAGLRIEAAQPEIEGMPELPCPIAELPEEILVHILGDLAVLDVGDFVRFSQVCKRFAYLVATENRIWRRICLGSEFGFGGMHYHWQKQFAWHDLTTEDLIREMGEDETDSTAPPTLTARAEKHTEEKQANTLAFFPSLYGSSWQRMFRLRPRVRFNGCYISTNNYIRQGQSAGNHLTWNSPVHIVTYYRYLRFFRDGTCLSLTTTSEPTDVVHHLTREALALHADGAMASLPSAVVQSALKGRWRLANAADNPTASLSEVEGDLLVETEGVGKYMYRLDLSLRSAGKTARNNKLVWRNFFSYHTLTDDWAEFGLKNDKPFFFSRVKSYGVMGE